MDNPDIYLDYNASTPVLPEITDAMRPFLSDHFGNPSSTHWAGAPARVATEHARSQIASLIGCAPDEILLTSGGSEANNHAIKGTVLNATSSPHLITTAIEHPAVLEPCRAAAEWGARVTVVPVDQYGIVDPDDIRRAITPQTVLISVMHANNEVGSMQPITAIATLAREHDILCHTDAAQSAGKVPTLVKELGVDLLSLAGHKLYAPKGVGALYVRQGVRLTPLIHGGGHERGQRAGTESALLAAGLGAACSLAERDPCALRLRALRDRFWQGLHTRLGDRVVLNGHPVRRLPNTLSVAFPGHRGDEVLSQLPGVAASTGSACHTGEAKLSPVLSAMGVSPEVGIGTIRFSVGRGTNDHQIDHVVRQIEKYLCATSH